MRQKLHKAKVYRYCNKLNDINEQVKVLVDTFEIELAISTTNGAFNSANNVKTTNSTHTGFTYDNRLRESDIIELDNRFYSIDFINELAHFPIIYLKQVENIG